MRALRSLCYGPRTGPPRFLALALLAGVATAQPSQTDAVRFLEQSTFGANAALIDHVQNAGFAAFIEEQFGLPPSVYPELPLQPTTVPATCTGSCIRDNYTMYPLQVAFFKNALMGQDQLRQRVALALHEILVVSGLEVTQPSWIGPYLQLLMNDAFGNYRQILQDITLNPAMGRYLNMAGNNKTAPNENYGREILQLFSIGLNMLRQDGTVILDSSGIPVPTYSQATVTAFARLFTGWNFAAAPAPGVPNYKDPMVLNNANHDTGAKTLLNGVTLPAGRTGAQDLKDGLDNIFQHPNVGPFIGKQLLQHLVTSNPSPSYVSRVAAAFNDNGAGIRGDMKAVIRAILLDPEARNATPDPSFGHLREPVFYITSLLRAFNTGPATTDFVLADSYLPTETRMGQDLFRPASVFSYFPPGLVVHGLGILGPEFGVYSTSTALARSNFAAEVVYKRMSTSQDRPTGTWLDLSSIEPMAQSPYRLINSLEALMLAGNMSPDLRAVLTNALAAMTGSDNLTRARRAVYLIATSPEYQIAR